MKPVVDVRKSRDVLSPTEVVIPPLEGGIVAQDMSEKVKLEAAITGMLAVGVEPGEAFSAYLNESPVVLMELAFSLVQNSFRLVECLYSVLTAIPEDGRMAFGQALMTKHGLNPMSVAMCAVVEDLGDSTSAVARVKELARGMGVDEWIVNCLVGTENADGWDVDFVVDPALARKDESGVIRFPGKMVLLKLTVAEGAPGVTIDSPGMEVSEIVWLQDCENVELRGLIRANAVTAYKSKGISLPDLVEVVDWFNANDSKQVKAPVLEKIGDELAVMRTVGFSAPRLETIETTLYAKMARKLDLTSLVRVGKDLNMEEIKGQVFPSLKYVGLALNGRKSVSAAMPSLVFVGGYMCGDYSKSFSVPILENTGSHLSLDGAKDFNAPLLMEVGGRLNAENAKGLSLPSLERVRGAFLGSETDDLLLPRLKSVAGATYVATPGTM